MAKTGTAAIQNCLLPLQRAGRGFRRGAGVTRFHSAIKNLLTTPVGFYPWAPDYGWRLERLRTQGISESGIELARTEVAALIAYWIPGVAVQAIEVEAEPDTEDLEVAVLWVPENVTLGFRRTEAEPYRTTVRA